MGKVRTRASVSGPGDRSVHVSDEKNRKPRTKRKKRKDLEELHRNVLEAKRKLRMQLPQKRKRKTALEAGLKNFADKRQENDDAIHGSTDKNGGKKKSRTICNRLLPETILGIYQNGAKGKEIQREISALDNANAARLRGDVLKLLNGDETNPKLPQNKSDKRTKIPNDGKAHPYEFSNVTSSNGDGSNRANNLVLRETKSVDRTIGESRKSRLTDENGLIRAKDVEQFFFQKENKCKRRLFEPNEDQRDANGGDNLVDRDDISTDGICFSPPRNVALSVTPTRRCFEKRGDVESTDADAKKEAVKNLMPIERSIDGNFGGWSPAVYYERLCAMICAENFDSDSTDRPRGSDPVVKIRKSLRNVYENARRYRAANPKRVIAKGNKHQEQTRSKVSFPAGDSSLASTTEIQACTTDSELDQDSSDSEATKVRSWRRAHFGEIFEPRASTVSHETIRATVHSKNFNEKNRSHEHTLTASSNNQNFISERQSNDVKKTMHSVSLFLDKMRENNSSNEKGNIFQVEVAAARLSGRNENSSDCTLENISCGVSFDENFENFERRTAKHVPTILRRSTVRCGPAIKKNERRPEEEPKRRTRIIAAMSEWSSLEPDESDDVRTPESVNERAVVNGAGTKIIEARFNFVGPNYDPREGFIPSENRDFEKSMETYEEKRSANDVQLVRLNDAAGANFRGWHATGHVPNDHRKHRVRRTNIDGGEQRRGDVDANFENKNDNRRSNDANFRTLDTVSPEVIREYHRHSTFHSEAARPVETAPRLSSSFHFVRPDVSNNRNNRDRRNFVDEMRKFAHRGILENRDEDASFRGRGLPNDSQTTLSMDTSRPSSSWTKKMEFPTERYSQNVAACSNAIERMKNRCSNSLSSFRTNVSSVVPLADDETGCPCRDREISHRRTVRKPVMLFRPHREIRERPEIHDSHYRLSDNGQQTINDTVTNLRVLTFNDNPENSFATDVGMNYIAETYGTDRRTDGSSFPSRYRRQSTIDGSNRDAERNLRPSKFLALDEADVGNPRRLPIWTTADGNFSAIVDNSNDRPTICSRCRDVDDPGRRTAERRCCEQQGQLQRRGPLGGCRVGLVLSGSGAVCRRATAGDVVVGGTAEPIVGPTGNNDIPRVVYTANARDTVVPGEMTYKLETGLYAQSRRDNENHSNRVQLPDGRVGILVTENSRSIDNRDRPNCNGGPTLSFGGMNVKSLNELNRSTSANGTIYY